MTSRVTHAFSLYRHHWIVSNKRTDSVSWDIEILAYGFAFCAFCISFAISLAIAVNYNLIGRSRLGQSLGSLDGFKIFLRIFRSYSSWKLSRSVCASRDRSHVVCEFDKLVLRYHFE